MLTLVDLLIQKGIKGDKLRSRSLLQRRIRRRLRSQFGSVGRGFRWRWDIGDPNLPKVHQIIDDEIRRDP